MFSFVDFRAYFEGNVIFCKRYFYPQNLSLKAFFALVNHIKLIANWWAWELVPKRLAGRPAVKNMAKEVTRQPWKQEPPLPAAANWHRHTERVLSGKYLPTWNTYLHTPAWQQGGRRGSKNPPRFASTKQQGDPQRSAGMACKIMQNDSGPETLSGPPRMSRMLIRGHRWLHWLEVNLA